MKYILEKIKEVNQYIKDYFLKLSIILFIIFVLISVVSYFIVLSLPEESIKYLLEQISIMYDLENMATKNGFEMFLSLFIHNLRASGMNMISFIIPTFIFPVVSLIVNGAAMGVVFGIGSYIGAENMFLMFLKFVLPHGIFEIPEFILSCAIGIKFTVILIKKIFGRAKEETFKYHFDKMCKLVFIYVIPFLLIAAFLEGIVEPFIFG